MSSCHFIFGALPSLFETEKHKPVYYRCFIIVKLYENSEFIRKASDTVEQVQKKTNKYNLQLFIHYPLESWVHYEIIKCRGYLILSINMTKQLVNYIIIECNIFSH